MLLTQNSTFIIGPVAKILGFIMDAIFELLNLIKIPNIGLSIILFTIVIYLLLLPLTIRQQKFSKLSAKMSPELQAIQNKYKDKRNDQEAMMAMNSETQAVYAKYGVSPSGTCLPLLIQMPILFALYRVIYAIPAYVGRVRDVFVHNDFITNLMNQKGSQEFISSFKNAAMYTKQFGNEKFTVENTYIDILNQASTAEWQSIATEYPSLAEDVAYITENLDKYNNFLGLNIANSPSFTVSQAFDNGQWLLLIGAILIPLLSAVTQWINVKLMPNSTQTDTKNQTEQQAAMMSSMTMMNYMMPITSAIFCFTLPAGMGIYWIAGSVVRTIQQIAINKYIDKMDIDKIVEKNKEKYEKKKEKIAEMGGYDLNTMNKYANMRTKNITSDKEVDYKNNSNLSDKHILTRHTDIEHTNLISKQHGQGAHQQRHRTHQGLAQILEHQLAGVPEEALHHGDDSLQRAAGFNDQQHQVTDHQAAQNTDQRRQQGLEAVTAQQGGFFFFHHTSSFFAPDIYRPSSSTVVVLGSSWPTNSPSYITRIRSDTVMTSSSSRETSSTALPASRWATICLWIYSMAPTSRPRVGWTAISSWGALSISRAMMAFCWLPPDMDRVTVTGPWPLRISY